VSEVNVGVLFKSYEPLKAIQAYARQTEESGFSGGFWIAEAYHWFRQYGLESRGCFTTLAAATMATKNIPIGLGITSPYMRHPTMQASEAAGIDELSGGRFIMGLGVGMVGIQYLEYDINKMRPVKVHHESLRSCDGSFLAKNMLMKVICLNRPCPDTIAQATGCERKFQFTSVRRDHLCNASLVAKAMVCCLPA